MTEDHQGQQQQIDTLKDEVVLLKERVAKLEAAIHHLTRDTKDAFRIVQDRLPRTPPTRR